jgi:hypothetical protein
MKKLLDKISKRGGFSTLFRSLLGFFESFEYVQNFWCTLIGSNVKKKHMELFFIFI